MPNTSDLQILFATPEIRPLIKTGGLADISASLPAALRKLGVDVRVLVPGYPAVMEGALNIQSLYWFGDFFGFDEVHLLSAILPGTDIPLLIIEAPQYYTRGGGPYQDPKKLDWPDNALRFALLSRMAAYLVSSASPLEFRPKLLHCNDWQTGLAPAYLHFATEPQVPTVLTIHNLAFQGIFPPPVVAEVGLPPQSFAIEGVEYYGNLSFLKAGLYYATHITTVSPNYAEEIQREPLGFGMQGLLKQRAADLTGIVNGIDNDEWNPAADPHIARNYGSGNLDEKAANKAALQKMLGLAVDPAIPLLGAVSRISYQKGLDMLLEIVPTLLEEPVQLVILGTGEALLEQSFTRLVQSHPGKVAAYIGFDEKLSHLVEAGIDMFLMPSRFEPCGLNQMYSQRYGTPPIVHATGGLVDTVIDTTPETLLDKSASGFLFGENTAAGLLDAIRRALGCYRNPNTWRQIQLAGMNRDFSWDASATRYLELYRSLLAEKD
ncbi:MAG: glycogen synthase GlgA [Sulfuricella sp.]|nr:glycogen synthase GlgA [Sulfuricella sp.]